MKAGILSIGNELIEGYTLDTNAKYFSSKLNSIGVEVSKHLSVIDDKKEIINAINYLNQEYDLIIISGGLGPTNDDLTKESVAQALNLDLKINDNELQKLKEHFINRGYKYNSINDKQAMYTDLDNILINTRGTANGYYFEYRSVKYCVLPGPPIENQPLFEQYLKVIDSRVIYEKDLYLINIGETSSEELILDLYKKYNDVYIGCYMQDIGINYRIKAENKNRLEECFNEMKERFKDYFVSSSNDPISEFVSFLIANGITISFAESCTAGLACSMIGDIPNASKILNESLVTYSNKAKQKYLGVSEDTLKSYGAVSKQCAKEMAIGLYHQTDSNLCISITGIAGPSGGSAKKPVGLVYFGVYFNNEFFEYSDIFRGTRTLIRQRAAKYIILEAFRLLKHMM